MSFAMSAFNVGSDPAGSNLVQMLPDIVIAGPDFCTRSTQLIQLFDFAAIRP